MIRHFLRAPAYPVLVETDVRVVAARSLQKLEKLRVASSFQKKDSYVIIDSKGEGWSLVPEAEAVSPLTITKRWGKQKIIDFYNASLVKAGLVERYEARSLSNRTVARIIEEVANFDERF